MLTLDKAELIAVNWKIMPGTAPILIDVAKFDAMWKNSNRQDGWLDVQEEGTAGKRARFMEFAESHKESELHAPTVFVTPNGIRVMDGRHRYCVLRDLGVKSMIIGGFYPSDKIAEKIGITAK